MTLLGFADDVLDLPWRYKMLLPCVASLPLLATYTGGTSILIPRFLGSLLAHADNSGLTPLGYFFDKVLHLVTIDTMAGGAIIELGMWYLLYMGLLAVFATNAINIYAGINGLEAGQSVVISVAIITANLWEIAAGAPSASPHLFSAQLGLPFLAVTLGALAYNVYPASVFVGDTFCYFAGMTFAVHGILGHFSKTMLLFFIPQIINFVYSLPQLFKVYPCPRHRLPNFDVAMGKLVPSTFEVLQRGGDAALSKARQSPKTARARSASPSRRKQPKDEVSPKPRTMHNFTLINLVLHFTGPLHERTATNVLLLLQVVTCALGLFFRFKVGPFLY
jgi:UDP-N-acetylglucosamine--dolichyl-phosphate N-acetylglucosaminephosphotransferase